MKKITFGFFMMILPYLGFAQVIDEGFEGATFPPTTPGNWITMDNGVGTAVSWTETTDPTRVYAGLKAAIMDRENVGAGNTSIDWLVSPRITVPTNGQLQFFTRQTLVGNNGSTYEIRVSTDPVQTNQAGFTNIPQTWTESTLNATYNIYEEKKVSLAAFAGQQVYIAFVKLNTQPTGTISGDRWLIDNVKVVQQCLDPSILGTGAISPTTAVLTWQNNGGVTTWDVYYNQQADATVPDVNTLPSFNDVNTNNYLASGFLPGTSYKYWVRAQCSATNLSNWVGPFNFTTTPAGSICSSPILVTTLPYSHTDNTSVYGDEVDTAQGAGCAGGATNYMQGAEVFYSYTATFTGNLTVSMTPGAASSSLYVYNGCGNVGVSCLAGVADTTTNPRNIATLPVVTGQTYIFVISSSTTPAGGIPYTLIIQEKFCDPPVGAPTTAITTTTATINWTGPAGATAWQYVLQDAGMPVPAGAGTPAGAASVPLTGLVAAHAYQYWVRSDCGNGQFSPWAGPYRFNTETCEAAQKCNYVFRMTDSFGDGWDGGGRMEIRQNGIVVATIGSTFTTGTALNSPPIALCETLPLEIYFTVPGASPTEIGVEVINNFGQTIVTLPRPLSVSTTTPIYTTTFDCDTPACLAPTAINDTTPTTQGATLSWTPNGGTVFDVYVVAANPPSPAPNASTVPTYPGVTGTSLVVTGLNPNTMYLYYVRTVCGPGQTSVWTPSGDFTTLPTCSRPTLPVSSGITPYTATLNWTQPANPDGTNATTWEIIVLPCGSPAPTEGTPSPYPGGIITSIRGYTVGGLTPVSCYDFYVRAVCSSTDNSPWSVKGTFNTPDVNDECVNSKLVPVNQNTHCEQTVFGTVAGATASTQATTCAPNDDNDDVWFHFVATATTHYISLLEPVTDTSVPPRYPTAAPGGLGYTLYRGNDCSNLTQISCRSAANGAMETGLVIGQTYKIRVYSRGTAVSTKRFEVCVGTKVIYCENSVPVCAVNDVILRNDVGVPPNPNPISGTTTTTVGCLGSAPSPTFYYLTIQQDGNYTYFMEQSTDPTFATVDLDVDYVTWGPYPSVATACTSINVNNTRPAPQGCSFSAAATETFTLNGALAGQVYVIMITNYTANTLPGKRGYIRIKRTSGPAPIDCCPFASFSYPGNFFCKGGANITPTLSPGSTAGTYTSTAGLVINSTTGVIDIAASTVGTYTVTSNIPAANDCAASTATWSLTISDPATATIAYSAPEFCRTVTAAQPVTQTGTPGGYYYAVPAGLTVNATTGAITPSTSLAGTYTVRYNVVVPGCSSTPFETTVTITALPVATFAYAGTPYCQNAGTVTPTYSGGGVAGVFTASPSTGLVIDPSTGAIDLAASTVGTYTVTNTIAAAGGCAEVTANTTVTITALPVVTFTYAGSPYCQVTGTATPTFTGGGMAGTFTANPPTGLIIDPATGVVDLTNSTPGDYTVTNTVAAANGCSANSADATISVRINPVATISSSETDNTICSNESATLTVVPTNFLLADATYAWTLNGTTPVGTSSSVNPTASGTYEVVVTLNGCTNTTPITTTFTVNVKPDFTLSGTNLVKCPNETAVLSVVPTNFSLTDPSITYTWTRNTGALPNTTSSISVTDYGMYEVTVNNQGCITSHQIEVTMDMTDIPIGTVGECQGAQYVITASPVNGSFDGATVTYEWTNGSGTVVGTNQNTFNVSQYVSDNGIPQSSFPLTFTVKITTTPEGCTDTQSFVVDSAVCVIPRGLSPNGDGDNDNFDLSSLGVKKLSIFNRYGNKVYGKTNYTNQWEGQSDSGEELPDGTYYYVIEQTSGETKSGWVYINR